jgi:hypothetical protein
MWFFWHKIVPPLYQTLGASNTKINPLEGRNPEFRGCFLFLEVYRDF